MSSVNEVRIIGNLGADPEVRKTRSDTAVANLSVATHRTWTDGDGERQERTDWHRIVCWGQQAGFAAKYLSKGDRVYIAGRLQNRSYQTDDGETRNVTEVVARRLIGLSPDGSSPGGNEDFSENALMGGGDLPF